MLVELTYDNYKYINQFLHKNYIKLNSETYMAVYNKKTHKCKCVIPFEDWYILEELDD